MTTLLIGLVGLSRVQALTDDPISRNLPIDGPFWSQWSTYYGCSQFKYDEFCRFPSRHKLESWRYRVCLLPDDTNYPDKIFDNQAPQGMFQDQVESNSNVFTNRSEFERLYNEKDEKINLSFLVPQTADPGNAISRALSSEKAQNLEFIFR